MSKPIYLRSHLEEIETGEKGVDTGEKQGGKKRKAFGIALHRASMKSTFSRARFSIGR